MKIKSIVGKLLFLMFISWSVAPLSSENRCFNTTSADDKEMLNPVPKELIVNYNVDDSAVLVVRVRCVVHVKYSEDELSELEKKCKNEDEWKTFYDDYSFYNDDVSMFLYERALVKTEFKRKYIQFLLTSGEKITVDRLKSAGKLFFFNPESGLKQCDSSCFDQRRYRKF